MKIRKEVKHILSLDSLAAGASSRLIDCETIDFRDVRSFAITVRCFLSEGFTGLVRVAIFSSPDGFVWDSSPDWDYMFSGTANTEVQNTNGFDSYFLYGKVVITNQDSAVPITDIDVWVTLCHEE